MYAADPRVELWVYNQIIVRYLWPDVRVTVASTEALTSNNRAANCSLPLVTSQVFSEMDSCGCYEMRF